MDVAILTFFNQTLAHPVLDVLAVLLTIVGYAMLPSLGLALLIGPHRRLGVAILLAFSVGLVAALTFQGLAMRPRPTDVRVILQIPNLPSYPSGHATAAFSTATILILTFRSKWLWAASLTIAILISLSRLYLGHHYPTDILAGAVLGASLGATAYGLLLHTPTRALSDILGILADGWQWFLWPQFAIVLVISAMASLDILPTRLLQWPYSDKAIHFLVFGAVAFWLNLWLKGKRIQFKSWSIPLALLLLGAFAIAEESSQSFSSLRTLSLADLTSNFLGLWAFWWLSELILRKQGVVPHRLNSLKKPVQLKQ